MKRINPLLRSNNPAPIPGCHAPEGCCTQCCGYLDFTYQHTESPVSWPGAKTMPDSSNSNHQSFIFHYCSTWPLQLPAPLSAARSFFFSRPRQSLSWRVLVAEETCWGYHFLRLLEVDFPLPSNPSIGRVTRQKKNDRTMYVTSPVAVTLSVDRCWQVKHLTVIALWRSTHTDTPPLLGLNLRWKLQGWSFGMCFWCHLVTHLGDQGWGGMTSQIVVWCVNEFRMDANGMSRCHKAGEVRV
jgi:hypothetical protein